MFNGLIKELANVIYFKDNILSLKASHKPNLGDSIAVNGACLSVIRVFKDGFDLELSNETQKIIALENYKNLVHIEPALRYCDRIEGHLIQGHIDGIGIIDSITPTSSGTDFYIKIPKDLLIFTSKKGSIAIDGVSLTINDITKDIIRLTIIPISFKNTLFHTYKIGQRLNIESDLFARYVARILKYKEKTNKPSWQDIDKISYLY